MKRLTAIILILAFTLTFAACDGVSMEEYNRLQAEVDHLKEIIENESSDKSTATPFPESTSIPDLPVDNSPTAPQTPPTLTLAVAKGYDAREIVFRFTIPGLQNILAIPFEEDPYFVIFVRFGEHVMEVYPKESVTKVNPFEWASWYTAEQDDILISVCMPDACNWDVIDSFDVSATSNQLAVNDYFFSREEVEVPLEQILTAVPLTELSVDFSSVNLSAVDNRDGTMTFTLEDTSLKPLYIYPWSWVDIDSVAIIQCSWFIFGKLSFDPKDEECAIKSYFSFSHQLSNGDLNYPDQWNTITVDMERLIKEAEQNSSLDTLSVTVNENGLSATQTNKFEPGYGIDDIAVFEVIPHYIITGRSGYNFLLETSEWSHFDVDYVIQ